MCKKHNPRKVDKCMEYLMKNLRICGVRTKACCCGHGKYPMTIVAEIGFHNFELFTSKVIPRKKRFYKRDKQGYYYIPEVIQ